jgi:DDE superfamily endonuclease
MRRILSRQAYKRGCVRQCIQDGSREFITLIACVLALGRAILPVLLYKGISKDLQDLWCSDIKESDDFFIGTSENGWRNDLYGLRWLQECFEPNTRPTTRSTKRLLIVDGHSSYINLAFIDQAY